ncbi:MAG: hypothetical protein RIQ81_2305 [Pseudomonadota bacterium]|jgi:hypothetical protein
MLKISKFNLAGFSFMLSFVGPAHGASFDVINEFYGEVASLVPDALSRDGSRAWQTMMIATTRIPLRLNPSTSVISPILSAGFSSISGTFASTGVLVSTPWLPNFPGVYAGARVEWRAFERGESLLLVSASGEARQGEYLRFNAGGDVSRLAASGQIRAMLDALRFPGLTLGAGVGGQVYQSEGVVSSAPQAITELRCSFAKSFLVDLMARASPGDVSPQFVLSFGGAL